MMLTIVKLQTMALTYAEICRGASPWVPLGNFMMDFFRNFPEQRAELVVDPIEEPTPLTTGLEADEDHVTELHKWAVFCAASVEYLCDLYDVDCPDWVHNPLYDVLPEPWYFAPMALKKPNVRARIEQQTPAAFARRNIYCGDRVFVDKREAAANHVLKRQQQLQSA